MELVIATENLFETFSLKQHRESLTHCMEVLIALTQYHVKGERDAVVESAMKALQCMIRSRRADRSSTFNLLLQHLMPSFTLSFETVVSTSISKRAQAAHSIAIEVVLNIVNESHATERVDNMRSLLTLVQHMAAKCPEKSQYRVKIAETISQIIGQFPAICQETCEFLFAMSKSAKMALRSFSVEAALSILSSCRAFTEHGVLMPRAFKLSAGSIIRIVLMRCSDRVPAVRARALMALAEAVALSDDNPILQQEISTVLRKEYSAEGSNESDDESDEKEEGKVDGNTTTPVKKNNPMSVELPLDASAVAAGAAQSGKEEVENSKEGEKAQEEEVKTTATSNDMQIEKVTDKEEGDKGADNNGFKTPVKAPAPSSGDVNTPTTPTTDTPPSVESGKPAGSAGAPKSPFHPQNRGMETVLAILHKRAADARPVVRKAAIQALSAILLTGADGITGVLKQVDLQVLFDGCMDESLSIRKQSLIGLTDLLSKFGSDTILHKIWLGAVLPLVNDNELTVQEKCFHAINENILEAAVADLRAKLNGLEEATLEETTVPVWRLLAEADDESNRYLQLGLSKMLTGKAQITIPEELPKLINKTLLSDNKVWNDNGLWVLIEAIARDRPDCLNIDSVVAAWNKSSNDAEKGAWEEYTHVRILRTLSCLASDLESNDAGQLAAALYTRLSQFGGEPNVIQAQIAALKKICINLALTSPETPLPPWENNLLVLCQKALGNYVFRVESSDSDKVSFAKTDIALVRYLFTLGEVVLQAVAKVTIPDTLLTLVQSLLPRTLGNISGGDGGDVIQLPVSVRAHAFTALGKLCLKNEALAKKCVTIMVRELEDGTDAVIRNNVLVIFCDLCRTFTSIVDLYVPSLTRCIKDPNPTIRRHTLMVVSQLIQEDFLKWKGSLFFRFVSAVADEDAQVRQYAEQNVVSLIVKKAGNVHRLHLHFPEMVFYLNACHGHTKFNSGFNAEKEGPFTLPNVANSSRALKRRMTIYRFLLKHMTDDAKFTVTMTLCREILGAVVDGKLPTTGSCRDVIQDCLIILASADIKLTVQRTSTAAANEDLDELEMQDVQAAQASRAKGAALALARGKLISALVKKNAMENIIPILIDLKRTFERKQSPLLRYLMLYLKELLKDYRKELNEILANDRQLAAELEYDLRQFEKQQKQRHNDGQLQRLAMTPVADEKNGAGRSLNRRLNMTESTTPAIVRTSSLSALARTPNSAKKPSTPGGNTPVQFRTPRLKKSLSAPGSAVLSASKVRLSTPLRKEGGLSTPFKSPSPSPLRRGVLREITDGDSSERKADILLTSPDKEGPAKKKSPWNVSIQFDSIATEDASSSTPAPTSPGEKQKRKRGSETPSPSKDDENAASINAVPTADAKADNPTSTKAVRPRRSKRKVNSGTH